MTKKKIKTKEKITKDMTFAEVLEKWPQTADVFFKHGLFCAGCPMAAQERIEEGARVHGIKIEKLVEELNKVVDKKKRI